MTSHFYAPVSWIHYKLSILIFFYLTEKYDYVGKLLKPGEEPTDYSDEESATDTENKKENWNQLIHITTLLSHSTYRASCSWQLTLLRSAMGYSNEWDDYLMTHFIINLVSVIINMTEDLMQIILETDSQCACPRKCSCRIYRDNSSISRQRYVTRNTISLQLRCNSMFWVLRIIIPLLKISWCCKVLQHVMTPILCLIADHVQEYTLQDASFMRQSRCSFLNAWENTQVARAMTSVFLWNTRWRHGRSRGETKYTDVCWTSMTKTTVIVIWTVPNSHWFFCLISHG